MGSYISAPKCQSDYKVQINCSHNFNKTISNTFFAGNYTMGSVPPNPDIAGVGVGIPPSHVQIDNSVTCFQIISVFIAVTSFALALSILDVLWRIWRLCQTPDSASE